MHISLRFFLINFQFVIVKANSRDDEVKFALEWLCMWLKYKEFCGDKGTVIFDIDDTLLTYENEENEPMRLPAADIYDSCKGKFKIVIITARPELDDNRERTIETLRALRITGWDRLEMMPAADYELVQTLSPEKGTEIIAKFKRSKRDLIAQEGQVIANVGNMWTDLVDYPLSEDLSFIWTVPDQKPCILFPTNSHNEAAVKVPMIGW